jgi:hypothetical protein
MPVKEPVDEFMVQNRTFYESGAARNVILEASAQVIKNNDFVT